MRFHDYVEQRDMNEALDQINLNRAKHLNNISPVKLDNAKVYDNRVGHITKFMQDLDQFGKIINNRSFIKSLYNKDLSKLNVNDWVKEISEKINDMKNPQGDLQNKVYEPKFINQIENLPLSQGPQDSLSTDTLEKKVIPYLYRYYAAMKERKEKFSQESKEVKHANINIKRIDPNFDPTAKYREREGSQPFRHILGRKQ